MNDEQPGIFRPEMSFEKDFVMLPNDWIRGTGLSLGANFLLIYLMTHSSGYGIKFSQIEAETPLGVKGIRAAIKELSAAGWLIAERTKKQNGHWGSYRYTLVNANESETVPSSTVAQSTVVQGTVVRIPISKEDNIKNIIPTKKKSHIKEDWKPSESLLKVIDSKQKWATVNATEELEKFVNYHMAKGSMMVDWDRAFMTWLTNAEKWAKDKAAPSADRSRIKGWFE